MVTHKERLEALENNVSDIQQGMTKMFVELQRLSKSLNSKGDFRQGSPSQSRINEGKSGRVASPLRRNKLKFSRYAGNDPMEWLNHMAHYFEYQEVPEQEKVMMAAYYMEGKEHQWATNKKIV